MAKKPLTQSSPDEQNPVEQPPVAASAVPEEQPADASPAKPNSAQGSAAPKAPRPLWAILFDLDSESATDEQIQESVNRIVAEQVEKLQALAVYNILFLYDGGSLDRFDSNRIYQALAGVDRSKPILLVLRSPGGDIAAAYFIGKLCREYSDGFEVAVPREAKSAATLVCCGADLIHMGSLSELGPIDPQFGGMPALAVKHSLEHLAEIVTKHPAAKEMLSEYLVKALPVNIVGHFERAANSAAQYAERLLSSRKNSLGQLANSEIARRLVYEYKDHGFAIDAREATSIFGVEMVKTNSAQYAAANELFDTVDLVEYIVGRRFNRNMAFTGGASNGCQVWKRESTQSA